MGNICGKQESENFQSPGRPLNSAPPAQQKSSVPGKAKSKQTYTPESRVVGTDSESPSGSAARDQGNPASKAGAAALDAANKKKRSSKGLQAKVDEQRSKSIKDNLEEISSQNTRHAVMDAKTRQAQDYS
ncbi:hypothetical protein LEL_01680 [Akanthomyces lecanii RCEF 1005]|uniref:Uncharacterized protein n=1 Tax=Akanthomyces lecanii RCEF 1005 TaxID=1081108 RepID=A0A168KTL9_CORDF|nr:hypothetical protein LEL_01680 [Akanthomyces lecanii RCEF 1005]